MNTDSGFKIQKRKEDFFENSFVNEERKGAEDKTCALSAVLKTVFGYEEFRNFQKEIIEEVLKGNDVLAVMPTGGGKSLCYQIPALIFKGLTVVVSPLIALMRDQLRELKELGIPAAALNSSLERREYTETIRRIVNGEIKILYAAPETLATDRIRNLISTVQVNCIAVDEAHCISEWGHDFRPEYRQIAEIRNLIPGAACLALTATATEKIRSDIKKNLNLSNCKDFVSGFNRKNIYLEVKQKYRPFNQLAEFLDLHKGQSGIVYCFSRKQADTLSEKLRACGLNACSYHAGLSDEKRTSVQSDFIKGNIQIITATVAFGMGINKPDVRFVVHFNLPKTLEQYYQEIGRAGRDGEQAFALLLFSESDVLKMKFFLQKNSVPQEKTESMIAPIAGYARSEVCRRQCLLNYFGEKNCEKDIAEMQEDFPCCDVCFSEESGFGKTVKSASHTSDGEVPKNRKIKTTVLAQKIMSCILRTGSRFGASYIAEVLSGSGQKRILENGHDKLSVWGIGTELCRADWIRFAELLTAEGFLSKDSEYRTLYLTAMGKEKLKTRAEIEVPFMKSGIGESRSKAVRKPHSAAVYTELSGTQRAAAEALKKLRLSLADKNGVPAFVIFSDKTLFELAVKQPDSQQKLQEIFGIGKVKKERYGKQIIQAIKTTKENI